MINSFTGNNMFLSNFYRQPFTYKGRSYLNSEAAFQAQKCVNPSDSLLFESLDPSMAKKRGRYVALRSDWESVKVAIMRDVLVAKFRDVRLRNLLLSTGDEELVEGNDWHDNYWGDCSCGKCINIPGKNVLGKILMEVRSEISGN